MSRTTTHVFDNSRSAYDACQLEINLQTGKPVLRGDTLVIPSEQVVGIASSWPVAVTGTNGVFQTPKPLSILEELFSQEEIDSAFKAKAEMSEGSHDRR